MCEWSGCTAQGVHVHRGKFYCFDHWVQKLLSKEAAA